MAVLADKSQLNDLDYDWLDSHTDYFLNLISTYPRNTFLDSQWINIEEDKVFDRNSQKLVLEYMIVNSLIEMETKHICNLTKTGYEIHRKGGWLKHLNREKAKTLKNDKKDAYDYINAKWKSWTFWPLLFLAALGGIYSGVDFFTEKLNPKSNPKIEQIESELNKLKLDLNELKKDDLEKYQDSTS